MNQLVIRSLLFAIAASADADGHTMLTRLLCPYPQVARWDGQGDPNDASSFSCMAPQ